MKNRQTEEAVGGAGALTDASFWDGCYEGRELVPFSDSDWRNYVAIQLARLLHENLTANVQNVCELGGGDAAILSYLARKNPDIGFSVLDISPQGCAIARARAEREKVSINIHCADVFAPPSQLLGSFDFVYSLGVVEHFENLVEIMRAKKALLAPGGRMFTMIPNFESPVYAALCRRWSQSVWKAHVPHTVKSFLAGHVEAGLRPIRHGYVGSVEFGMLSMALNGPEPKSDWDRMLYLWLTRLSKAVHLFEYRLFDLPRTKMFAPFIYVVSEPIP